MEDTEAELSSQQDQVNRANATVARLREQLEEKKKEMERMQNRIDTLEDKLLEKAAGVTGKQETTGTFDTKQEDKVRLYLMKSRRQISLIRFRYFIRCLWWMQTEE